MCGIAGILKFVSKISDNEANQMLDLRDEMANRGPDSYGYWMSKEKSVCFVHRRLSIIDLSDKASQPMEDQGRRFAIVFNGEIYNYKELRDYLHKNKIQLFSNSDTEVILELYKLEGINSLSKIRGMFAFAIWDEHEQKMFLARDPLGIKPLYYYYDNQKFIFSSQVKPLSKMLYSKLTRDPAGEVGFYLWGHIPEPYTIYNEIKGLEAGNYLLIQNNQIAIKNYFNLRDMVLDAIHRNKQFDENGSLEYYLREKALDTIRHHLISDVSVSVFLSSGIDSATITALASEISDEIKTITLGFEEYKDSEKDETVLANLISKVYNTTHFEEWINKEKMQNELERIFVVMDQPSIDGINTYFISKAAKNIGVKVALSGLGGDEIFGGYPDFNQIPKIVSISKYLKLLGKFNFLFKPLIKNSKNTYFSHKYAELIRYSDSYVKAYILRRALYMPDEIAVIIGEETFNKGWEKLNVIENLTYQIQDIENEHIIISILELSNYMKNQLLRDSDWAGMSYSLEIRTPLVDVEFIKAIISIIIQKKINKKMFSSTPAIPLPPKILNRKKTGFNIPVRDWLIEKENQNERGLRGFSKYVFNRFN